MLRTFLARRRKTKNHDLPADHTAPARDATPDEVPPPGPPIGFDGHPLPDHQDIPTGSDGQTIYGPGNPGLGH